MKPNGTISTMLAAAMALTLVTLGWFFANQNLFPPNSLPWKPLVLDAPPNWIAHWQLNHLKSDGQVCRTALAGAAGLRFTPVADRAIDGACGFHDVVRIERAAARFAPSVTATCSLTAALYWYEQQLAPVALAQMHSRLTGIDHVGVFACRNVNHDKDGARSEHAAANAIDVTSFRFADGKTVSVTRDYGRNSNAGRFLDAARAQACKLFNGVLGPRYNRLHATHFHLDMGPYRICA